MRRKEFKKLLGMILCLCMAVMCMPMVSRAEELPAGPAVNGDVWTVTPQNAQYTLDGAYGSIDGKTIHFGPGVYSEALVLARPTKYDGSNTKYYNKGWMEDENWMEVNQPLSYENFMQNPGDVVTYERKVSNVTFTAEDGVVLTGFESGSGHVYQSAYDYVRDIDIVNTNTSYYGICSLDNVTFSGLTIKDNIVISNYMKKGVATNSGISFSNCTFKGDADRMSDNAYSAIRLMADTEYFDNIKVSNCKFTNYFQGIYSQGTNGIQVKNNVFDGTTHNAIAVQSSTSNKVHGAVVIEENIIKNAGDRAIRFGDATEAERITIENNVMLDSGDSDGELIRGIFPDSSVVSLEHNYWDGKTVETAVANEAVRPQTTGIVGGTFTENVDAYKANGYVSNDNGDGTFTVEPVEPITDTITLVNEADKTQTIKVGAGEETTLPIPVWAGHDFEGWYDSGGNKVESYTATADGTGNVTLTARWKHIYSNNWITDENSHWHECACGDRADIAGHTFRWMTDKEATATEKGLKHEVCEVCGYKKAAVEIPAADGRNQGKPGAGQSADVPQTGDNSNLQLWIVLFLLASGGLACTLLYVKKRKTS